MKKVYLILAATLGLTLASCTSNEYIGDVANTTTENDGSIQFSSGLKGLTRADHVGKDAADKLNGKFIVAGFKDDGSTVTEVFDDYVVSWSANTAGTTLSNTSDWEYVGLTANAPSSIAGNVQAIKYWDYATTQYDFAAYSTSDADAANVITNPSDWETGQHKILVSNITKASASVGPTYYIRGDVEDLAKVYISDLYTAYKATMDPAQPKYQDEVNLSFRNLTAKARVALYETIPGYSVKDVKFYTSNTTPTLGSASETSATLFAPNSEATDVFYTSGTATVSFPTRGSGNLSESDYNKAHVAISDQTTVKSMGFGNLVYTGVERDEKTASYGTEYLARYCSTPSFANNGGANYYKIVMPNENGAVLELRVDYTLVPIDGASETIKVNGATAYVPAIYAAWKSNYAYTYIFKISDNTNGWTDPTGAGPAGLYPITFDAVVVDSEEHTQSTITTVATPSITTYQKGHVYTDEEYDASKGDIYVMAMDNNVSPAVAKTDIAVQGYLYAITNVGGNTTAKDEANVMDALNIPVSSSAGVITGRNGLVLTRTSLAVASTIPGPDGNDITISDNSALKFSPVSNTTYAFCYLIEDNPDTYIYSAETLSEQPSDWGTSGVWYMDPNGETPVVAYANGTYYKKYKNDNKVYAVKVIKVKA